MFMEKITRVGVRFTEKEAEVFTELARRAEERTRGYATLSDIAKELMGFLPPNLLTEKDLELVRSLWKVHGAFGNEPPPKKKG